MSPNTNDPDPRRTQLLRLLDSSAFRASAVHRDLLSYLAERALSGNSDELKEYTVGIDALGKGTNYDPRADSSVRMHIARIRQKINEYYLTEGKSDPILIDLPKGGFRLTFEPRVLPITAQPAPVAESRWLRPALWCSLAVICGLAVYIVVSHHGETQTGPQLAQPLDEIWRPILSSDRPLALCLSAPLFVSIPGTGMVSGPFDGDWGEVSRSGQIATLKRAFGASDASPSFGYTDVATATAAFHLGQFLQGRVRNALVTRSDLVSLPELKMDNVIYVGSPQGNAMLQAIPSNRQFALDSGGVRNLHPSPDEPAFIPDAPSESRIGFPETHSLITVAPGTNGSGYIFYLVGNNDAGILGAVEAMTDPAIARKVFAKLIGSDGRLPRYYQLVVSVRSMEEMPVDVSYALHKNLAPQ